MWIAVTLHADADKAEALSDALMEAGALSVSSEDADAGTDAISYKVRAGDTLDLIAAEYYGDRNHSIFTMAADDESVFVNPMTLRDEEINAIVKRVREIEATFQAR